MTDGITQNKPVVLKSKDGQSTVECGEKIADALIKSGKYVRVAPSTPNREDAGT
jgi:hypothetical protein